MQLSTIDIASLEASLEPKDDTTYESRFGGDQREETKAVVVVGGSDPLKCVPNINSSRWDDEAFLNINFRDMDIVSGQRSFTNGLLELTEYIEKYGCNVTWRSYALPLSKSVLEKEIEFSRKPLKNKIELDIAYSDNLEFCYQPIDLTSEEIELGARRPDNVKGSYAVYFSNVLPHGKYLTGKFCHLFNWEIIDARDNRIRAPITIDEVNKKFIVELDQKFIDEAVYPIIVMGQGDTIGYDSCGGTAIGGGEWQWVCGPFTAGGGGTIDKMYMYADDSNSDAAYVRFNIQDDDGGEPDGGRHSYSNTDTQIAASSEICLKSDEDTGYPDAGNTIITNGNDYHLGFVAQDDNLDLYYDTGTAVSMWRDTSPSDPPDDPFAWSHSHSGWRTGIVCEFTAAGATKSLYHILNQ